MIQPECLSAKQLQLTGVAHKLTVFNHEVEVTLLN